MEKIKFFISEVYKHRKALVVATLLIRFGIALWEVASVVVSHSQP